MDQILLVIQGLIALALVGTILMQRSEGGALGIGGGPGGMMTARGAGNFLTKATTFLAVLFLGMCILLAIRSGIGRGETQMENFDVDKDGLAIEGPASLPDVPEESSEAPVSVPGVSDLGTQPSLSMEAAMEAIDPNALAVPKIPDEE